MVKILKILSSALLCAAGLAAVGPSAKADIIPVADPYFNQFPTGPTHPPNFPAGFLVGPGAISGAAGGEDGASVVIR